MVIETLARTGLILIGRFLSWMPRQASLFIGGSFGFLLERLAWKRVLIRSNLLLAFPGATEEAMRYRSRLEHGFYRHFGNLVVELLSQFGDWAGWVRQNVELRGLENWERASAKGKGVIFVTSHLGNWEAMAAGFAGPGANPRDVVIVTKHLKPEWLHRSFERNRLKAGVRGTYEPKTMRDVLSTLKRGGTVGFVLDQYAGAPIGVRVPFFGVPVGTLLAPAVVARRTGAAVLPASCHREAGGRLQVRLGPEFDWASSENPHEELALNTARWVAEIEREIRACPEQWLWSHRRFKGNLDVLQPDEWKSPRERT